eukprot:942976-Rhodomonas_salina.1
MFGWSFTVSAKYLEGLVAEFRAKQGTQATALNQLQIVNWGYQSRKRCEHSSKLGSTSIVMRPSDVRVFGVQKKQHFCV